MRNFTVLLFVLTIVTGYLSYRGLGDMTETLKLSYAYLALTTLACALISFTMREEVRRRSVTPAREVQRIDSEN